MTENTIPIHFQSLYSGQLDFRTNNLFFIPPQGTSSRSHHPSLPELRMLIPRGNPMDATSRAPPPTATPFQDQNIYQKKVRKPCLCFPRPENPFLLVLFFHPYSGRADNKVQRALGHNPNILILKTTGFHFGQIGW